MTTAAWLALSIVSPLAFLVGFVAGTRSRGVTKDVLALWLAAGVATVWALVLLTSIVTHDYQPATIATPVMLTATGYLFGYRLPGVKGGAS